VLRSLSNTRFAEFIDADNQDPKKWVTAPDKTATIEEKQLYKQFVDYLDTTFGGVEKSEQIFPGLHKGLSTLEMPPTPGGDTKGTTADDMDKKYLLDGR
jgi:hypothetical protein